MVFGALPKALTLNLRLRFLGRSKKKKKPNNTTPDISYNSDRLGGQTLCTGFALLELASHNTGSRRGSPISVRKTQVQWVGCNNGVSIKWHSYSQVGNREIPEEDTKSLNSGPVLKQPNWTLATERDDTCDTLLPWSQLAR